MKKTPPIESDQNDRIRKTEFPFIDGPSAIKSLNFVNPWDKLRVIDNPVEILSRILQHSLLDGERVVSTDKADEIARLFIGKGGRCYTNITFDEDGDAAWTPMTNETFDAGLIIISDGYLRSLWVVD